MRQTSNVPDAQACDNTSELRQLAKFLNLFELVGSICPIRAFMVESGCGARKSRELYENAHGVEKLFHVKPILSI